MKDSSKLTLNYFPPSQVLQPFIKCYYILEGDFGRKTRDVFFADGCIEMIFNFDVDFYRNGKKEYWAKVIGQITEPLEVMAAGKGKCFGIWFHPHGFSNFSNIPVGHFTDKAIQLNDFFEAPFLGRIQELNFKGDVNQLITFINAFFERKLIVHTYEPKNKLLEFAMSKLTLETPADISILCDELNISRRYLELIFAEKIGLSPKLFQRILKFQKALSEVKANRQKLTEIAYEFNYFDQPHFIREFKKFTDELPSNYQKKEYPISYLF
ncbi:DUF6597 domain-containing transcriptional factor [Aquiflexum sp.]|uniref:DUF6597 domain-containing transcriptional factor n=1 Tax=Aquiflexum sp. TaxID=1872584 RepID=UPI003594818A